MIPLFKPYMPELPELNNILSSGSLAAGKWVFEYENKLKQYFNEEYILVTNSFASAIKVSATTLGLVSGDEVVVSPMGCLASTQPYASMGLKIKWCDVDPKTGTLDPDSLRKNISINTKAIVHNHFCGYPGYIDEINAIGAEYGIPVIDDGIECFGSEYKGEKIGHCGTNVTVFSTTAVRLPNTIDGGIIIFNDKRHYEKAKRVRDCGIDRILFRDAIGEINPLCDISEIGYSATMSNVNAYIGACQMENISQLISRQRCNAKKWFYKLQNELDMEILTTKNGTPNYWVFGILAKNKTETIQEFRNKGYYASGVHINNNRYSVFYDQREFVGVTDFYNHFVALPCGWWMGNEQ
ncbi:MAG: aminotransferase class V-fold PLP-dependent enzyme [Clostridia bacterium]|nr:aminotransferase class V-fold PLP-dependent enzyme [Clostridia bacterium]